VKAKIRKIVTIVEETRTEMGRAVDPPTRRAAAIAVIENPFAGRYVEDLTDLMDVGEDLGDFSPSGRSRLSGLRVRKPRATARRRRSARTANLSTRPRSCIRSWARRPGKCLAGARR
jgi:hypothetical protein